MCIAIYKRIGNQLPKEEYLKNCWENNPDGAGFAFNTRDGRVKIVKGLMTWESFKSTLDEYTKKEDLVNRGMLIHFRIETHGGVCPECTHPFPITSDEAYLQKPVSVCEYAVIHNGIISLTSATARTKTKMSDTMVFVQKYLSKLAKNKRWFDLKSNWELIYDMIDSKMACLNGKGEIMATYGFDEGDDHNFYSNTTYKWARTKTYSYDYRGLKPYDGYGGWYDDDEYYSSYYGTKWSTGAGTSETKKKEKDNKKSSVIFLMELAPHQYALSDEYEDCYYDPQVAVYIDENQNLYWGSPSKEFFLREEIEWMGSGIFCDEYGRTVPYKPNHSIQTKNISGMDGDYEEDVVEHKEKESDSK